MRLAEVAKLDIKGKLLVWRRSSGERVDIPLSQLRALTRESCRLCPDFAASLAICQLADWVNRTAGR